MDMTSNFLWFAQLQGVMVLALAPFVIGALNQAKARLQRRQGPSLWQPYRDLLKLLHKRAAIPFGHSWAYGLAPVLTFTCYGILGFLTPVFLLPETKSAWPIDDLLLIIALLGLGRLALALGGMSVGAPFGNLGSGREMFLHVLAEPILILVTATLALTWRTTDLSELLSREQRSLARVYTEPALLLLLPTLALTIVIEAGRLPFDNPETHLELTMLGAGIHLQYAGPHLALLAWAEWARLTFLLTLLINLVAPWSLAADWQSRWLIALAAISYPLKLIVLALGVAAWEATQVRIRLRAMIPSAFVALAMAFLAVLLVIIQKASG
jgi:formate hydrogenlyase subunit 4